MYMCNRYKNTCTCFVIMTIEYMYMFWYDIVVRQRKQPLRKGSEEMEMTASQIVRLIEWLKANGFNDKQIVECIEYINK